VNYYADQMPLNLARRFQIFSELEQNANEIYKVYLVKFLSFFRLSNFGTQIRNSCNKIVQTLFFIL